MLTFREYFHYREYGTQGPEDYTGNPIKVSNNKIMRKNGKQVVRSKYEAEAYIPFVSKEEIWKSSSK